MFGFSGFSYSAFGDFEGLLPGTVNGEVFYFSLGIRATTKPQLTIISRHEKNLEIDVKKQFDLEIE